jgi:2'-5' RNA ligase
MPNQKGAAATRRLFFALWPEADKQHELARLAQAVLPAHSGKVVATENLHATVLFLGSVSAAQQLCVESAASQLHTGSFVLSLDRVGYFRRPQVVWAGCRNLPPELLALVSGLRSGCAPCGMAVDDRPFELHVTLVRHVRADPGRPLVMPVSWALSRFALVESVSDAQGVHYQPLRFWDL